MNKTKPRAKARERFSDYRSFIRDHYDGAAGAFTSVTGVLTGHALLAGRVIRAGAFDVSGCKRLLDAACGNGRYTRYLLRRAAPGALVTTFDLSPAMLKRARNRFKEKASYAVADLTRLPYADGSFDAVVCGWVLEHLPDPRMGLGELARVLTPGGKLLLLCTEDTVVGKMCGRLWHCRTYARAELRRAATDCDLRWERDLWFTDMHKAFRMGGIVAELRRPERADG